MATSTKVLLDTAAFGASLPSLPKDSTILVFDEKVPEKTSFITRATSFTLAVWIRPKAEVLSEVPAPPSSFVNELVGCLFWAALADRSFLFES